MKKLKAVLILLLALVMSLALFACGGGEEENPGGTQQGGGGNEGGGGSEGGGGEQGGGEQGGEDEVKYNKLTLRPATVTLTDSDDQAAFNTKLAAVQVTAQDLDSETYELTLEDCKYDASAVKLHEVGEYSFEVTPKDGGVENRAMLTVVIDHNWKTDETNQNVKVCQYDQCKARQETTEEDVIIHYGAFHEGTGATVPSVYGESSVYTNKKTTSNISEFGSVNGRDVPTLTAGKLEPGMTITISGKVMTSAGAAAGDGPWGHANENYNSPSLGIADRYYNNSNSDHLGYAYGTSVIVRQEGWVLYNGIGDKDNTNTLAGILGGFYTTAGGWRNYGSHPSETDTTTPGTAQTGYVHGEIPTDWSQVHDWWVYSTGDMHRSLSAFTYHEDENGKPDISQAADYVFTWNYREDGIIEITYTVTESNVTDSLKIYIKVPAPAAGYYDTIIHGDFNDMTVTKSVVTTKRTPTNFKYNGVKANSNTVYAENKPFDATTLNVQVQYEQTGAAWNDLQVSNSQVYYYLGTLTRDQLGQAANAEEFKSIDPEKWACLGTKNSLKAGAIYKIHIDKGGKSWDWLIPATDFTVLANRVDSAEGANVSVDSVLFANNDKVGDFAFSVDAKNKNIVLTLTNEGYVQTLTADQKAKLTGTTTATKYVALRLNAGELGTAFTTEGLSVKKGSANVAYAAVVEDEDLYLVLAVDAAGQYTVTGAQGTAIVLDLSKLKGFSIDSAVSKGAGLPLNKGGEVTLTYTVPTGTKVSDMTLSVDGSPLGIDTLWIGTDYTVDELQRDHDPVDVGSYKVTSATYVGNVLTLKLAIPAANLANYASVKVELSLASGDVVVDYVDYDLSIAAATGYVQGSGDNAGNYAYVSESGKLSVVKAYEVSDLKNGEVVGRAILNVNNGNVDGFKATGLLTVDYRIVNGELVLVNAPASVTGYAKLLGTFGDSRDIDKGAYVVLTVDLATLGIAGDYYFEFVDGAAVFNPDRHPTSIYKVSGTTVSSQSLASGYTMEPFSAGDGNCYDEGLYAWAVTKDGKVVCYAGAAVAGGEHVDADNNNKCDICGGTITHDVVMKDWNDGFTGAAYDITEGTIIDATGSINESGLTDVGGNMGPFVAIVMSNGNGGNKRYWLRTDGCNIEHPQDSWDAAIACYPGNVEALGADIPDEDFYTSLSYNTLNGAQTVDGEEIATATLADYLAGKTFRYVVSYIGTTVKVVFNYYNPDGSLSLTYYVEIRNVTLRTVTVQFISDDLTFLQNDGKITVTTASAANSVIADAVSETVDGHTAPTSIKYATAREGSNIVLGLSGSAPKDNGGYYAAFKVNFTQALVASTRVALVNAQGTAIGKVTLAENRESLTVYLPIAAGMQEAYLRFTNYEASTAQSDIKIDVRNLVVSDITSELTGADALNIGAGNVTVTYTGAVQDTDTLVIGGVSKAISELKVANAVDFGNGYSAKATVTATSATVTITKAAADITKVVKGVEIRLERNGSLLATNSLAAALTVTGGKELNDSPWYVKAEGSQLILFSNAGGSLYLNVNAGEATDEELVNIYNLSVNTNNGAFDDANNALTKVSKTVHSVDGDDHLYVIIVDLKSFGVEGKAYGYQAVVDGEAQDYYTVNAQRVISNATAPVTTGTPTQLVAGSCIVSGVAAYKTTDKTFYYNVTVTAATGHTWVEKTDADKKGYDKVYECSVCKVLKYEQTATDLPINKTWGSGKPNAYAGWGPWEELSTLQKGSVYEITGVNYSNADHVWDILVGGISPVEETVAQGFRIDNYMFGTTNYGTANTVYEAMDYKTNTYGTGGAAYTVTAKALSNGVNELNTLEDGYVGLDGATVTYTFDYSREGVFVLKYKIVNATKGGANNGTDLLVTVTVTLEDPEDAYKLYFNWDGNLQNVTTVSNIIPADGTPIKAYEKHAHDWSKSDKCECGEVYPEHGVSKDHPHIKGEDDVHCSVCGAVMEHTHKYNSYYVCEYCGVADNASIAAMTVADANLGLGAFGGTGAWWGCASDNITTKEGDFLAKITFSQGTSIGITGALEVIYTVPGTHGNGYLTYNPDDTGHWGGMIEGEGAAVATLYAFGTKPTTLTNVTYEIYVWRIGTTMVADYRVLDGATLAWEQVIVVENVETQALNIHINGYTNGYTDLKGYTGTITEKA